MVKFRSRATLLPAESKEFPSVDHPVLNKLDDAVTQCNAALEASTRKHTRNSFIEQRVFDLWRENWRGGGKLTGNGCSDEIRPAKWHNPSESRKGRGKMPPAEASTN